MHLSIPVFGDTVSVLFIPSFANGSTALCWALASTSVRNLFYTDGRTPWTSKARRKAATYTQDNTNTE
jgi:hypothetical protein